MPVGQTTAEQTRNIYYVINAQKQERLVYANFMHPKRVSNAGYVLLGASINDDGAFTGLPNGRLALSWSVAFFP